MMENNEIMVSIYCKAYNHEKYIRDCLEGFVNQKTDFRYEVIIHDDASTDGTADIIREYERKYPDIVRPIYQTENQYSKRVKVFSTFMLPMMRGKYIACCEGDDYWTDDGKLQMQVDFLESHPDFSACVHNTEIINMSNGKRFVNYPAEDTVYELKDVIGGISNCYHTSSLVYRIAYARERPDFLRMQSGVGDYPLGIYLALSGRIQYFGRVMSVYRYGTEGSWTRRLGNDSAKKVANYEKQIAMLEAANEYSEHRYDTLFLDKIGNTRCEIVIEQKNYPALKEEPYKQYYDKFSFKDKMKVFLLRYCPFVYHILRRFKRFYI